MSILNGILGNKTILNTALGAIRSNMQKDGVSCIVLQLTDDMTGETPGLEIKSYGGPVGVLSGQDLTDYSDHLARSISIWPKVEELADAAKKEEDRVAADGWSEKGVQNGI